jgi:hypothetical protein
MFSAENNLKNIYDDFINSKDKIKDEIAAWNLDKIENAYSVEVAVWEAKTAKLYSDLYCPEKSSSELYNEKCLNVLFEGLPNINHYTYKDILIVIKHRILCLCLNSRFSRLRSNIKSDIDDHKILDTYMILLICIWNLYKFTKDKKLETSVKEIIQNYKEYARFALDEIGFNNSTYYILDNKGKFIKQKENGYIILCDKFLSIFKIIDNILDITIKCHQINLKCTNCMEVKTLYICIKCNEIKYCGKNCQKADWNQHKKKCRKM